MDLFVSVHCPQCGANISFEEESTAIQCPYCGTSLHITGRSGILRHYITPRENVPRLKKSLRAALKGAGAKKALIVEKRLYFAPYWRIKGMAYRWIFGRDAQGGAVKELKAKHLDRSFPAYRGIDLGLRSLGIRPGALTLPFFDRTKMAAAGTIMTVDIPFEEGLNRDQLMTDVGLDETRIQVRFERTRLVGERRTLIYFPFWAIRIRAGDRCRVLVVDGVANTVTRVFTEARWKDMWEGKDTGTAAVDFGEASFIALKCPNCGWDLPVSQFDVIHFCKTCRQAWMERGGRFRPVKYQIAAPFHKTDQELVYLPFWVCRTQVGMAGQVLKTAGDMKALTGLPGFPAKPLPGDSEPFRFFVPALRIRNILAADKLAAGLTRQQPAYEPGAVDRLEDMNTLGVFLPPQTAAGMTDLLLCSLVPAGNGWGLDRIQNAETSVRAIHLLLWPFFGQRLFLRDAICGLGIQKGTLGLSR